MRDPYTARISNLSVVKYINPEQSLEMLLLNLMVQYFYYLVKRADSLKKILMLGKMESEWRRRQWWMR